MIQFRAHTENIFLAARLTPLPIAICIAKKI